MTSDIEAEVRIMTNAIPDLDERVLLLGPGPEWQEGTVRSVVSSFDTNWVRVENDSGYLFGFEIKDGQLWWREIEVADWIGGTPHSVKLRAVRGSATLLRMTPDNLARRQRDIDIAIVTDAVRGGVGAWAPDVLRRVADVLREGTRP